MKNRILIILSVLLALGFKLSAQSDDALVMACSEAAGDDANYLKDFVVVLDQSPPNERFINQKFSMVLSKNTEYRFSICTSPESDGKGVIQLFDSSRLLGSSFNASTGKEYPFFDFKCQKTGVYHVFVWFQEGKAGKAVGILSYVQRL